MGKKKETKIWDRFTSIENCRRAILNACKNHHTWEAKWISDPERIDDYAERLSVLEQIDKESLAGEDGKFELETIIRKKHGYYFEGTLEL